MQDVRPRMLRSGAMSGDDGQVFETLHEIVKAARINLNQNFWDYLIGGTETETTVRRNRQALDSVAFRPRVLRNTAEIDLTTKIFGKSLRIPVMVAPVGSLQSFEAGGGAPAGPTPKAVRPRPRLPPV